MTTPRIYFPHIPEDTHIIDLGEENLRYLKTVLRLKKGSRLVLFDGTGYEYGAVIRDFDAHEISVEILGKEKIDVSGLNITLAQSLAKSAKMDFIVQKATELGVTRIIPFVSDRSIPRLSESKSAARISRWRKITVEASRQCKRITIPVITDMLSFRDMLELSHKGDLRIIFWEEETERGLKDILRNADKVVDNMFLIVGPEGGFSREEVEEAIHGGFVSATLGKYILRTETVGLTILSIVQYERGILGSAEQR